MPEATNTERGSRLGTSREESPVDEQQQRRCDGELVAEQRERETAQGQYKRRETSDPGIIWIRVQCAICEIEN
jgi:hypothetical protein